MRKKLNKIFQTKLNEESKKQMQSLDRRTLLRTGIAMAVPLAGVSMLAGCQQSSEIVNSDESPNFAETNDTELKNPLPEYEGKKMQVRYLEIVTPDVDALCKLYSSIHGIVFSDPDQNLGSARTAKLNDGGLIGIRAPMRDTETPVIRPYMLVENLEKAVAAAAEAGAEIAIPRMEIPGGHGTIGIVIQGGIECGLWQD